jgi:serine/threonine-protein kinase HipA
VSNTDDHLRNHGFIFSGGGWALSPAYDINPTTPANGLHLFISEDDNSLSYELAMDVIDFFRLNKPQAQSILDQVRTSVATWEEVATQAGISRNEQTRMEPAFNL